ncbi:MAG: hypothetical protein KC545_01875, partial [Nitrospira sp.]|nr:hypothetical protein [Nitrospira sp.]
MKQIYYSVLALCVMWFFVLGSSTVSQAQEAEEKPRLPIAMEGVLKKPMTQQYELHLHLTNISDEPVDVDVRDLPWNPTDGPTWLLAFRLHQHRSPIKQDTPFGKFGSRRVTL